jgi:hypothetical protein
MTERKVKPDEAREALQRAATYLKWWRDGAIDTRTKAPTTVPDIIVTLERLVVELTPDEAQPLPDPPRP